MTDCGYTPAQIRRMTMPEVNRLMRHWQRLPPLRDLLAKYIGFEPPPAESDEPAEPPKYMTAEDFKRLMAMTGGRVEM